MPRCRADSSIQRLTAGTFAFPLGVYPIEPLEPKPGYTVDFEPADQGDGSGPDFEEWPDRYVFDAVLSADRVPGLVRALLQMMPSRIYPILDVLGHDAFREIDPYVSYELMGSDRLFDAMKQFRDFFFEDGLCGFGAMCEEPFLYVFVDEHKIVTVRAEATIKERVERVLAAFDLAPCEDPAGADAAAHEHRGVLLNPEADPDLMSFDEIVEYLREEWRLVLNVDPESNTDDQGHELGTTAWWCRVRVDIPTPALTTDPEKPADVIDPQAQAAPSPIPAPDATRLDAAQPFTSRYVEVVLAADCLREAEDTALGAAARLTAQTASDIPDPFLVFADRINGEQLDELLGGKLPRPRLESGKVFLARWEN